MIVDFNQQLLILINEMKDSKKPIKPQSGIRTPLNKILGAETYVRILRALYELNVPISLSELARHIKMDKSGVWRAVNTLEEFGPVESIGLGRHQAFQIRREYPLSRQLIDLFRAERLRVEKIIEKLSEIARSITPPAISVWIEGSVALESDKATDPVSVAILAPSSNAGKLAEVFRSKAAPIQKQFGVVIEVRSLTSADLAVMNSDRRRLLDSTILLAGIPPTAKSTDNDFRHLRSTWLLHREHDDRSLALSTAISNTLRRDRTLVRRALVYIKRRLTAASPREAKELQEWRRILQTYSQPQLRHLLTDTSERSMRLRQSSPFPPILTASERAHLLEQMRTEQLTSK